ncbi:isopentenyl phosphate kinase family protein [Candidatus Thorarchaeota archaeon]|nr:MAG: isopentenyl phosphate kinase family protein [Candidatus Thorarchaeota archaeon]
MTPLDNLVILKLGGSVITHKERSPPEINRKSIIRICEELLISDTPLILVLGGGAHGHQPAKKYGFANLSTPRKKRLDGIPEIRYSMNLLASAIQAALSEHQVPCIIIPPIAITKLRNGYIETIYLSSFRSALKAGITVITHGDVCFDAELGAAILSGDALSVHLARELGAKSVLLGTDVDGVLDDNPNRNPDAKLIPTIKASEDNPVLNVTGPSKSIDVTGGMKRKLKELFTLADDNTEIIIFNLNAPGRLRRILLGEPTIGTRIVT